MAKYLPVMSSMKGLLSAALISLTAASCTYADEHCTDCTASTRNTEPSHLARRLQSSFDPNYVIYLLRIHGSVHIAFWGIFLMFHVMFMFYLKYHARKPMHPELKEKPFLAYMLLHHLIGGLDIAAICVGIYTVYYSQSKIVDWGDVLEANVHRVAGLVILALSVMQELSPLVLGRHPWAVVFHRYAGRGMMVWVIVFQIWSGIDLLGNSTYGFGDSGWNPVGFYIWFPWVLTCVTIILTLYFTGISKREADLTKLHDMYTGPNIQHAQNHEEAVPVISAAELNKHTAEDSMWVAINGVVLDVSDFRKHHPGGADIIAKFAGKDASAAWNMNHPPDFLQRYAAGLVVGVLEDCQLPDWLAARHPSLATKQGALASVTRKPTPATLPKEQSSRVIIVGGGLAGMSAAHAALQAGAPSVLVLDKMPYCGGNSVKATSGINGSGTRVQAAKGIKDSPEAFFKDTWVSASKGRPDAAPYELGHVLTFNSADAVHWLLDFFNLQLTEVGLLGGHSAARTHRPLKGQFPGMAITSRLIQCFQELAELSTLQQQPTHQGGGLAHSELRNNARVVRLIRDTFSGAVSGVEYVDAHGLTRIESGVVILATGGWGADFGADSLIGRYRPDLLSLPTTNGEHCTGDGVKLTDAIGGGVMGLDLVQVHPTGLVDPTDRAAKVKVLAAEALRGAGGLLLTAEGSRFCNELGRRDYVTGEMNKFKKAPYRLLLNRKGGEEMAWHVEHYGSLGIMRRVENAADVAQLMGIPLASIKQTFDEYRRVAAQGHDDFGKCEPKDFKYADEFDVNKGPFFVSEVTPVVHFCMGGVKIAPTCEVLTQRDGTPITGLYAAGEVAGGVHGENRLGGSSLLACVVFGRIAGTNAAQTVLLRRGDGAAASETTADKKKNCGISDVAPQKYAGILDAV